MAALKLYMNEFGLLRTEDSRFGIRQINEKWWAIQYNSNPVDPWQWQILAHTNTKEDAIKALITVKKGIDGEG